jgi:hypothetical protein
MYVKIITSSGFNQQFWRILCKDSFGFRFALADAWNFPEVHLFTGSCRLLDEGKFIEELLKQQWEYVYFFADDPNAMWEIWKN